MVQTTNQPDNCITKAWESSSLLSEQLVSCCTWHMINKFWPKPLFVFPLPARGTNAFCAVTNALVLETNAFENARSNFSHTHTASYQRLSNGTYLEMIATHWYSPPKRTVAITLLYSPLSTLHHTSYTRTSPHTPVADLENLEFRYVQTYSLDLNYRVLPY